MDRLSRSLDRAVLGHPVSGRDPILVAGGMFLLMKATTEIHHRLEGTEGKTGDADQPGVADG